MLGVGVWRAFRVRPLVVAAAAAAGVVAVAVAAAGPLRFSPKPWNAAAFAAPISGQVVQDAGATRGLVSAAATADGNQRALLRADLLIEPRKLDATSFQLEFLPSGMLCTGRVTKVQSFGFDARCRADDGTRRFVHASWRLTDGSSFRGRLAVHT